MDALIDLAQEAVETVTRRVRKEKRYSFSRTEGMGADGTTTLYIDKVAEEETLQIIGSSGNILSEEIGAINNKKEYTFIIDPIDGTRNAVHGIPFYGISIAIAKKNVTDVEYGIVKNIPSGDIYEGFKDTGAFLNKKKIHVDNNPTDTIYIFALGHSGNEQTWKHVNIHVTRAMGAAAIEMCLVASGAAQAYFMPREILRVTDFAAAYLIVREAEGEVYTATGELLDIPLSLTNRSSILAVANNSDLEVLL